MRKPQKEKEASLKNTSRKDDSRLRTIIKNKLFSGTKEKEILGPPLRKQNKTKQASGVNNRYDRLLCEFYGSPSDFNLKANKPLKNI